MMCILFNIVVRNYKSIHFSVDYKTYFKTLCLSFLHKMLQKLRELPFRGNYCLSKVT